MTARFRVFRKFPAILRSCDLLGLSLPSTRFQTLLEKFLIRSVVLRPQQQHLARCSTILNNLKRLEASALKGIDGGQDSVASMGKKRRPVGDNVEETHQNSTDEKDLYKVLGVERNASQEEIRKAYHKLALRLHPDKNQGDESAKDKFQSLQSVIGILGDVEKRKIYDETGSVEDVELSGDTFTNLYQFFKALYKQISEDDIDDFALSFRGSKEEEKYLKDEYRRRKGDMDLVFTHLMCSNPKLDSHRFKDIINSAISDGELKEFKVYRKWAAEVLKEPAPLNPLAQPTRKKKEKGEPSSSLLALIGSKSKERMNNLASVIEAKYGSGKKSKPAKIEDEPSEEQFLAAQRRLMKKPKRKTTKVD